MRKLFIFCCSGDFWRAVPAARPSPHRCHVHHAADWTLQTAARLFATSCILSGLSRCGLLTLTTSPEINFSIDMVHMQLHNIPTHTHTLFFCSVMGRLLISTWVRFCLDALVLVGPGYRDVVHEAGHHEHDLHRQVIQPHRTDVVPVWERKASP